MVSLVSQALFQSTLQHPNCDLHLPGSWSGCKSNEAVTKCGTGGESVTGEKKN